MKEEAMSKELNEDKSTWDQFDIEYAHSRGLISTEEKYDLLGQDPNEAKQKEEEAQEQAKPEKKDAPEQPPTDTSERPNYDSMNKVQLTELAKSRGFEVPSRATRAEIIEALESDDGSDDEGS